MTFWQFASNHPIAAVFMVYFVIWSVVAIAGAMKCGGHS